MKRSCNFSHRKSKLTFSLAGKKKRKLEKWKYENNSQRNHTKTAFDIAHTSFFFIVHQQIH